MRLQRGSTTRVVRGVSIVAACLVFALGFVVEVAHMLDWIYDDQSGGGWSETSVGLVMAEASVEEGENRVVCGIN